MAAAGFARLRRRRGQAHDHHQRRRPHAAHRRRTINAFKPAGRQGQHGRRRLARLRSAARRCATSPRKTGGKYYEVQQRQRPAQDLPARSPPRRPAAGLRAARPDAAASSIAAITKSSAASKAACRRSRGYVLTTVKENPLVEVLLRVAAAREGRELHAAGRVDLRRRQGGRLHHRRRQPLGHSRGPAGKATTSSSARWSAGRCGPTGDTGNFTVATDVRDGKTQVVVTALDADDEFLNDQAMTATAVDAGHEDDRRSASSRWRRAGTSASSPPRWRAAT